MANISVTNNFNNGKMNVKPTDDNYTKALACLKNANGYIEYTVGSLYYDEDDYSAYDTHIGKIYKVSKKYVTLVGGKRVNLNRITNFNI